MLSQIKIMGYKSIAECDIRLGRINVLVGSNGSGKSNFISFFQLIQRILDERLQLTVSEMGGPDAILHFGRKTTKELHAELYFGNNGYRFTLRPTQDNRMVFAHEALWWKQHGDWRPRSGHFETYVHEQKTRTQIYRYVVPAMRSWRVYHFHDVGTSALVKQVHSINDNEYLREDARNLAAFLYRLRNGHKDSYYSIVSAVRSVCPFFEDFYLSPTPGNKEKIQLQWTEKGHDVPFTASTLSGGTLRFICLATVLLQPEEFQPALILIDEPELGLHSNAIAALGNMVKTANRHVIIATQSAELISQFSKGDLVVVKKDGAASTLRRLVQAED